MKWKPPPENWVKTNIDSSKRISTKLAAIGHGMRDGQARN